MTFLLAGILETVGTVGTMRTVDVSNGIVILGGDLNEPVVVAVENPVA